LLATAEHDDHHDHDHQHLAGAVEYIPTWRAWARLKPDGVVEELPGPRLTGVRRDSPRGFPHLRRGLGKSAQAPDADEALHDDRACGGALYWPVL
jgi:hypothetical protein